MCFLHAEHFHVTTLIQRVKINDDIVHCIMGTISAGVYANVTHRSPITPARMEKQQCLEITKRCLQHSDTNTRVQSHSTVPLDLLIK